LASSSEAFGSVTTDTASAQHGGACPHARPARTVPVRRVCDDDDAVSARKAHVLEHRRGTDQRGHGSSFAAVRPGEKHAGALARERRRRSIRPLLDQGGRVLRQHVYLLESRVS
jgi:hypothetical protein